MRTDHPLYSGKQIVDHESYHADVDDEVARTGKSRKSIVEKRYEEVCKREGIRGEAFYKENILKAYKNAYAGQNMEEYEIIEEMLADLAGGMNEMATWNPYINKTYVGRYIANVYARESQIFNDYMKNGEKPTAKSKKKAKANTGQVFESRDIDKNALVSYIKDNNDISTKEAVSVTDQLKFIIDKSGKLQISGGTSGTLGGRRSGAVEAGNISVKTSGDARTIALGITTEFVKKGFIDFRGIKLSDDPAEAACQLATHAMILRNPQFETNRIFYLKGSEIVGSEAATSYLTNSSQIRRLKK